MSESNTENQVREFTKKMEEKYGRGIVRTYLDAVHDLYEACDITDRQAEKFNILANHVVDMNLAIIGWRKKVSFDSEDDLIKELERMIGEALKLIPKVEVTDGQNKD